SGLNTRKIEKRVHELEQPERVPAHGGQLLVTLGTQSLARVRQHFLEWTEHQRERSTKLVADVTEERGLGAIDFGQRVRALPLLLVGASVGQSDRNLFGDPMQESSVGLIERLARMDSQNEEPSRVAVLTESNR